MSMAVSPYNNVCCRLVKESINNSIGTPVVCPAMLSAATEFIICCVSVFCAAVIFITDAFNFRLFEEVIIKKQDNNSKTRIEVVITASDCTKKRRCLNGFM